MTAEQRAEYVVRAFATAAHQDAMAARQTSEQALFQQRLALVITLTAAANVALICAGFVGAKTSR